MITLTTKAVEKLKEFSESEGIGHLCIRCKVLGSGCAGLSNDMTFDDMIGPMDETFEQDGITIIIDCLSLSYMKDVVLDWVETDFMQGFHFTFQDEAVKQCGCGSSYSP